MSPIMVAVCAKMASMVNDELRSNWGADQIITAVIDNLDREAMAVAMDPEAWERTLMGSLRVSRLTRRRRALAKVDAALAAVRPAAPAASDAARQAAHKGRE